MKKVCTEGVVRDVVHRRLPSAPVSPEAPRLDRVSSVTPVVDRVETHLLSYGGLAGVWLRPGGWAREWAVAVPNLATAAWLRGRCDLVAEIPRQSSLKIVDPLAGPLHHSGKSIGGGYSRLRIIWCFARIAQGLRRRVVLGAVKRPSQPCSLGKPAVRAVERGDCLALGHPRIERRV